MGEGETNGDHLHSLKMWKLLLRCNWRVTRQLLWFKICKVCRRTGNKFIWTTLIAVCIFLLLTFARHYFFDDICGTDKGFYYHEELVILYSLRDNTTGKSLFLNGKEITISLDFGWKGPGYFDDWWRQKCSWVKGRLNRKNMRRIYKPDFAFPLVSHSRMHQEAQFYKTFFRWRWKKLRTLWF